MMEKDNREFYPNEPLSVLTNSDDSGDRGAVTPVNGGGGKEVDGSKAIAIEPLKYSPALPFYTYGVQEVLRLTSVDPVTPSTLHDGLTPEEVVAHRERLGGNVIPIKGGPNVLKMLFGHFINSITLILGAVAVVSAFLGDWGEFSVVVFVILFNGLLGFYQEFSAERSLEDLKSMTAGSAKVIRGGVVNVIPIDEVVVGDVVVLEQGSSVPADIRLYDITSMEIDEALLTGEANPVVKHTEAIPDPELKCGLGDRKNMAFRNTMVTNGRGKGVVVAAGVHTEMGKLATKLSEKKDETTALQRKMKYMMYILFGVCLILVVVVFAAHSFKYDSSTLIYSTAVAIAILPESLVAVITVAMTISVRRMAQQQCIVRKLGALEVLGNVTDICSDKTGTLTENKMVTKNVVVGVSDNYHVIGQPLGMIGTFIRNELERTKLAGRPKFPATVMTTKGRMYRAFFRCAALCSSTHLFPDPLNDDMLTGSGNPTEIAIQVMSWKAQMSRDYFVQEENWELCGEYPFDSIVKMMTIVYRNKSDHKTLYSCTKGAPESIIALSRWRINDKDEVVELSEEDVFEVKNNLLLLSSHGLRIIALSERNLAAAPLRTPGKGENEDWSEFEQLNPREEVESQLIFLGLVGIYDPPRPESEPSVYICQCAGIKVRMLTGDHTVTALTIAEHLGIIDDAVTDADKVMSGPELDRMPEDQIDALPDLPAVVGRCSPESKVKMIEALHRRGRIVAMTGDGFNDSPSIKIADIGCAMGSGTDVTKGVADIVITDDNFATIVNAIAEGRRIADCIRKFVVHLLSGNVAEVIVLVIGLPIRIAGSSVFILSPIEILWLNMFTGSPPATGLSLDAADESILHVPPNTKGFFTIELISDTFFYGLFLGSASLFSFVFVVFGYHGGFNPESTNCNTRNSKKDCFVAWTARATAFSVLYLGLMLHAYNVRNTRKSVFLIKWFDNPWLWGSVVFGIVTLIIIIYVEPIATYVFVHEQLTWEWIVILVALIAFMALCELYKVIKNKIDPIPYTRIQPRKRANFMVSPTAMTPSAVTPVSGSFRGYVTQTPGERPEYHITTPAQIYGTGITTDDRSTSNIARENLAMSFTRAATHTNYQ